MSTVFLIVNFYYWSPYCVTCVTPILWVALFVLLRKRLKPIFLLMVILATPFALIIFLHMTYPLGMRFAAQSALPEIQQAVDRKCGSNYPPINPEGFSWSLDFGTRFSNEYAQCQFESPGWTCMCK